MTLKLKGRQFIRNGRACAVSQEFKVNILSSLTIRLNYQMRICPVKIGICARTPSSKLQPLKPFGEKVPELGQGPETIYRKTMARRYLSRQD